MKKLIFMLLIAMLVSVSFVGCAPTDEDFSELQGKYLALKTEHDALKQNVQAISLIKSNLQAEVAVLQSKKELETKIANGYEPQYILVLELKQSHFGLDLEQKLKDEANKVSFEIAVDKRLYEAQGVGTELLREFRDGSFWFGGGSLGDWVVTVIDKRIE